jgi:large subunit ribosomal protein L17
MFRNMVTSLLKHERIQTTDAKAKELRSWTDHIITLAKRGDLHARRQALSIVREKNVVHKLFEEANERFGDISGGYTRVVKVGRRQGDAAPVSIIELVAAEKSKKKKTKKKKKMDIEQESLVEKTVAAEEAEVESDDGPEKVTAPEEAADDQATAADEASVPTEPEPAAAEPEASVSGVEDQVENAPEDSSTEEPKDPSEGADPDK